MLMISAAKHSAARIGPFRAPTTRWVSWRDRPAASVASTFPGMGLLSRAAPHGAFVDHIESSMCLPARVVLNTTTGRAANPSGSGWEQPREPVRSSDTLPGSEEVARRRLRRTGRDGDLTAVGIPNSAYQAHQAHPWNP